MFLTFDWWVMSEYTEIEERLVALESRIAFQDHTIEELNAVLTRQQTQIDTLIQRLTEVVEQIGPSVVGKGPDSPPPHY